MWYYVKLPLQLVLDGVIDSTCIQSAYTDNNKMLEIYGISSDVLSKMLDKMIAANFPTSSSPFLWRQVA